MDFSSEDFIFKSPDEGLFEMIGFFSEEFIISVMGKFFSGSGESESEVNESFSESPLSSVDLSSNCLKS